MAGMAHESDAVEAPIFALSDGEVSARDHAKAKARSSQHCLG